MLQLESLYTFYKFYAFVIVVPAPEKSNKKQDLKSDTS